jgi:hypothetical protein
MALSLREVRRDPIAERALHGLMNDYTVSEEKSGLVLSRKSGDMRLFFNEIDDLHQWEFVQNKMMVRQIERMRALLTKVYQQRESWKVRALMGEAQLLEATTRTGNKDASNHGGDARYASLKRYLAKQFHPDHAPGEGIEKIVRNEIFKEIWSEIERLDEAFANARFANVLRRNSSDPNL